MSFSAENLGHDSRAVANQILKLAGERQISLTIMQLLKLVYYSHGWTLAETGLPLTRDKPQAWQHGPVYPLVYKAAPRAGVVVTDLIPVPFTSTPMVEEFTVGECATMAEVVDGYGRMHAFLLSRLTHEEGSPWHRAYNDLGAYSVIPDDWIESYFKSVKA